MPELFDVTRCNLPSVPKVSFDFVDDCTVETPPDAIFDCPDIEIPFAPFEIAACPSVEGTGTIRLFTRECHLVDVSFEPLPPEGEIIVTSTTTETDGPDGKVCQTTLHVQANIPVICPEFVAGGTSTVLYGFDENDVEITVPSIEFNIDRVEGGSDPAECAEHDGECRFIPEMVLRLPCPDIQAAGGITVTREGCTYTFNFGGLLEGICTEIETTEPTFVETIEVVYPVVTLMIEKDPELICTYIVDLQMKVPRTRIFRGTVETDATGCNPTISVEILTPEGAVLGVFNAKVWLRGCCDNRPIFAGTRVWLMYDYELGWMIISFEDVIIAPVQLTVAMYENEATAQFRYFDTLTGSLVVHDDLNLYGNAPAGAKGWAICNTPDGSGTWQALVLQVNALWVIFELTTDLASTTADLTADLIAYHEGLPPDDPVPLHNQLKFRGVTGAQGVAVRRTNEGSTRYEIFNMLCKLPAP